MKINCKKCNAEIILFKDSVFNNYNSISKIIGYSYVDMCYCCGYVIRVVIPNYIPAKQINKYIKEKYEKTNECKS